MTKNDKKWMEARLHALQAMRERVNQHAVLVNQQKGPK
jgi:hypothetical protein